MRTNPIEHKYGKPKPYPVSFKRSMTQRIVQNKKLTTINLDNGNRLMIREINIGNSKFAKLQTLYNAAGEWIKSKLVYFGPKKKKVIISEKGKLI